MEKLLNGMRSLLRAIPPATSAAYGVLGGPLAADKTVRRTQLRLSMTFSWRVH